MMITGQRPSTQSTKTVTIANATTIDELTTALASSPTAPSAQMLRNILQRFPQAASIPIIATAMAQQQAAPAETKASPPIAEARAPAPKTVTTTPTATQAKPVTVKVMATPANMGTALAQARTAIAKAKGLTGGETIAKNPVAADLGRDEQGKTLPGKLNPHKGGIG